MTEPTGHEDLFLLCRARGLLCALPLAHVVETMRPLPIRPLGEMPPFVRGLSIVRGTPVPVVDAGALLDQTAPGQPARFVTLRAGDRHAALEVEEVVGIRRLAPDRLGGMPPLLDRTRPGITALLGTLDGQLLAVLRDGRIVPDEVWRAVAGEGCTS